MKRLTKKHALALFYAIDAVLLLLIVLAFIPKTCTQKSLESSLLNPSHKDKISRIEFSKNTSEGRESLVLEKKDDASFWIGRDSYSSFNYSWPCDQQSVNKLLSEVFAPQTLLVKAESERFWKRLGIDDENSFCISFYDLASEKIVSLNFGYDDLLSQKISVRSTFSPVVYEARSSIKPFLKTDESFWADPFIYPQCATNYSRTESERLLRHGELSALEPNDGLVPDAVLKKDFENGSQVRFSLYKMKDEYLVIPVFFAGPAFSSCDKKNLEELNYRFLISEWTKQRLVEETK